MENSIQCVFNEINNQLGTTLSYERHVNFGVVVDG